LEGGVDGQEQHVDQQQDGGEASVVVGDADDPGDVEQSRASVDRVEVDVGGDGAEGLEQLAVHDSPRR